MRTVRPWGFLFFAGLPACFAAPGRVAQNRRAVLDRGKGRVTGRPGLGDNTFSALFGEYRLEIPAAVPEEGKAAEEGASEDRRCRVWLSGETLSFAGDWQPRTRISGVLVSQRQEGEALLTGFSFSGGEGLGSWTAVFLFPRGTATGLDDPGINALMTRWLNRFLYFLSLIKKPADLSFPAVFTF
jgi:hypothetical protein